MSRPIQVSFMGHFKRLVLAWIGSILIFVAYTLAA